MSLGNASSSRTEVLPLGSDLILAFDMAIMILLSKGSSIDGRDMF